MELAGRREAPEQGGRGPGARSRLEVDLAGLFREHGLAVPGGGGGNGNGTAAGKILFEAPQCFFLALIGRVVSRY